MLKHIFKTVELSQLSELSVDSYATQDNLYQVCQSDVDNYHRVGSTLSTNQDTTSQLSVSWFLQTYCHGIMKCWANGEPTQHIIPVLKRVHKKRLQSIQEKVYTTISVSKRYLVNLDSQFIRKWMLLFLSSNF